MTLQAGFRDGIHIERDGRVLVLTIDRQEVRNALHPAALLVLADAIDEATTDPALSAAVITSAGDKSFSSGMDLNALRTGGAEVGEAVRRWDAAIRSPDRLPVVAAVTADAVGGGFELTLKCDLTVAADDITFALPEVGRGMVPGGGATLLPARIPLAIALELGMVGDPITVQRAYELGLVNRVVPRADVLPTAIALARRIAANAPAAVAATRRLMWETFEHGAAASWSHLHDGRGDPRRAAESREGLAAFAEKRQPNWDDL